MRPVRLIWRGDFVGILTPCRVSCRTMRRLPWGTGAHTRLLVVATFHETAGSPLPGSARCSTTPWPTACCCPARTPRVCRSRTPWSGTRCMTRWPRRGEWAARAGRPRALERSKGRRGCRADRRPLAAVRRPGLGGAVRSVGQRCGPAGDTALRARLRARQAIFAAEADAFERARELSAEALELASRSGDQDAQLDAIHARQVSVCPSREARVTGRGRPVIRPPGPGRGRRPPGCGDPRRRPGGGLRVYRGQLSGAGWPARRVCRYWRASGQ